MIESPASSDEAILHTLYGETMGTRWRVDLCASRRAPLDRLHRGIQARLDAIVAQMSTWEPDSDLCRFNHAPAGTWHTLPDVLFEVLACAQDVARASEGAFDPTLGPLVAAWGFGADAAASPDGDRLADAHARVGWQRLQLDPAHRRALQPGGLALDLSAIAKGHAVDDVCAGLRMAGITSALVDVGGELRGIGRKPDGTVWRVLVETGDDTDDEIPCILVLDDRAVATSGTQWHRREVDGRLLSHTIDAREGRPVANAAAAVTVVADSAMHADAWSTALMVMGMEAGLAFASARGLAARFVPARGDGNAQTARATPAFEAMSMA